MASSKVAEKLLPLMLEALHRVPADQGLTRLGAELVAGVNAAAGATAFAPGDLVGGGGGDGDGGGGGGGGEEGEEGEGGDGESDEEGGEEEDEEDAEEEGGGGSGRGGGGGGGDDGGVDEGDDGGGGGRGRRHRRLDSALVVLTWDVEAQKMCQGLRSQYDHQCVQDTAHSLPMVNQEDSKAPAGFHTPEFNAIGFAKIKYLYNSLSLGYDVMAMDADVVVLRSPLPALLPLRPHLAMLTEKCEVVDMAQQLQPKDVRKPASNIGVLFARSEGPTLRCVERWFGDMVAKLEYPLLWDQEEFDKVMAHCGTRVGMRWHALDNRRFVSMCQPGCGCAYPDADMELLHSADALRRHRRDWWRRDGAPYADAQERTCGPDAWTDWVLVHYPCQGSVHDKRKYMEALMEGHQAGEPRVIKNIKKVIKRRRHRRRERRVE